MNGLTRANLQFGTFSLVSWLTFVGITQPVTHIGVSLIIGGIALYIIGDTFKIYVESFMQNGANKVSFLAAIATNAVDIVMFCLFLGIGFYLGFN